MLQEYDAQMTVKGGGCRRYVECMARSVIFSVYAKSLNHMYLGLAAKFFWYVFFMFLTLMVFTYYGEFPYALDWDCNIHVHDKTMEFVS